MPLAGDAFDGKLVRHLVAPLLGRGAEFKSMFGRVLPIPSWIYGHLERWHHLSFLRTPKTMQLLLDLRREALEPERLEALLHLVRQDLGFLLFRAVERTEARALARATRRASASSTRISAIERPVTRAAFEGWIADELAAIAGCVDGLLEAHARPGRRGRPRVPDRRLLARARRCARSSRRASARRSCGAAASSPPSRAASRSAPRRRTGMGGGTWVIGSDGVLPDNP